MNKPINRLVLCCILFAALSVGAAQPGFAQDTTPPPASRQTNEAAGREPAVQYASTPAELLTKARTQGMVRVIVGLNQPTRFQPEGEISSAQAEVQRGSIAQARQSLVQSLSPYGAAVVAQSDQWTIPYVALEINADGLQALQSSGAVNSIQEDHMNFPTNNSASLLNMAVPTAWTNGYDGTGYTVAILDTGVQATHNFFGGRVVDEYCSSTNSSMYMPYLMLRAVCYPNKTQQAFGMGAADPATCANIAADLSSSEKCDHGTHVAGIAAGNDGNGGTVNDGVARGANIIAIQVFTFWDCQIANPYYYCSSPTNDRITAFDSDIINGLNHVYFVRNEFQIAAVNMSLGGGYYTSQASCDAAYSSIKAAIDQLRSVKIATIISSGNDGFGSGMSGPGCISSAVSVGSTSDIGEYPDYLTGKISSFTNTNAMLDLLAPGYSIYSSITVPATTGFGYKSGTSMAAPQVTGAWAVVRDALPNASVPQILQAFQATGMPVKDDLRADGYPCYQYPTFNIGPCSGLTFKLINVDAAINSLLPSVPILTGPVNAMTSSKPKLTWTAQRANRYELYLDTVNPPVAGPIPLNSASYTPTVPLTGQTYYWQVRAFNDLGGVSALSDVGVFVVDVPATLSFTVDSTPTLTWTRISWATSYEVQIADDAKFTVNPVTYPVLPFDTLSFEVTNPLAVGTHYWRVRAYNGAKAGSWTAAQPIVIAS